MNRRRLLGLLAASSLLPGAARAAEAELPETLRLVVPLAAGSSLDARGRMVAEALGRRLQRRVMVDNRPGAGGSVGSLHVARARPDGSTLLFINNSHVVNPHIYPGAGYDALRDFALVAPAYDTGLVLVTHPDVRASSVRELVTLARSRGEPLAYASSGTGGMPHIAMELFLEAAGIDMTHVPYRGDGQALTDVLPGRVPLMISGYPAAQPHLKAGKLRALAVTSSRRTAIFPDVPTLAEAGFPAATLDVWTAVFAPARTPAAVVERLGRELRAAMATPALLEQFAATGAQAITASNADMTALIVREHERYARTVKKLGLRPE